MSIKICQGFMVPTFTSKGFKIQTKKYSLYSDQVPLYVTSTARILLASETGISCNERCNFRYNEITEFLTP